jgi:hypothetical protein
MEEGIMTFSRHQWGDRMVSVALLRKNPSTWCITG